MRVLMRSAGPARDRRGCADGPGRKRHGYVARASQAATAHWRVSFVAKSDVSDFTDIAAVSARDVWAVGSVTPPGAAGASAHCSALEWQVLARCCAAEQIQPCSALRRRGLLADRRLGLRTMAKLQRARRACLALRWTGRWSVVGFFPTFNLISDAVVFGPKNAWVFGGTGVRHFDGHRWTTSKLPYSLDRASALSPNDIWAVGADNSTGAPVLARCHNGQWALRQLPTIQSSSPGPVLTDVLARSDQDVWVTGGTVTGQGGLRPLSLHWHSGSWTQPAVHGTDHLGRVIADGKGGLWAAFSGPFDASALEHFVSGSWHTVKLPVVTGKATSAFALALVPRSATAYAAGSTVFGGLPGTNALLLKYSR